MCCNHVIKQHQLCFIFTKLMILKRSWCFSSSYKTLKSLSYFITNLKNKKKRNWPTWLVGHKKVTSVLEWEVGKCNNTGNVNRPISGCLLLFRPWNSHTNVCLFMARPFENDTHRCHWSYLKNTRVKMTLSCSNATEQEWDSFTSQWNSPVHSFNYKLQPFSKAFTSFPSDLFVMEVSNSFVVCSNFPNSIVAFCFF